MQVEREMERYHTTKTQRIPRYNATTFFTIILSVISQNPLQRNMLKITIKRCFTNIDKIQNGNFQLNPQFFQLNIQKKIPQFKPRENRIQFKNIKSVVLLQLIA